MERKVNIQDWQKVTEDDFDNFGQFPRESIDHVVGDLLIPDMAFTGFAVAQSATARVSVSAGRLMANGLIYFNADEGGVELDLLALLPVVTRKYIAVIVWGQVIDTQTEPRTFLTDVTTRATVARVVATQNVRHANIATVAGTEAPDPQKPAIASNVLPVAWVLCDPGGIVSIEAEERAPSLREADNRLNENDGWRTRIGTRLDTLGSDLAGLAQRLNGTAQQNFANSIAADLARTKVQLKIPASYTAWSADYFLSEASSDLTFVDWYASVEEGARFPDAAVQNDQIGLLNQFDSNVSQQNFFVLPAWSEKSRINVVGRDAEQAIAQYPYQTISLVQKMMTRQRMRFGNWYSDCTNRLFVFAGDIYQEPYSNAGPSTGYDPVTGIFKMTDGETFEVAQEDIQNAMRNHTYIRLRRVWIDYEEIPYWDNVVTTSSVSGSVIAQTFLNTQDGWLTRIDLYLTRVGASGNLEVLITEAVNGAPDYTKVIARTTMTVDKLKVYPPYATTVNFLPTFLAKGGRYAVVLVTSGNHFTALVTNNKYAQGTLFYSTDGAFAQGDLTKDLAFEAFFASFYSPRVEVQLNPLSLQNGIASIDILCQAFKPPQTDISWEVQVPGFGWIALNQQSAANPYPLVGLYPMLPFRAVLIGTIDSMPGFGVAANSRTRTRRPAATMVHISKIRTMPPATNINNVKIDVRLESWRGAPYHTFACKVLRGAGYTTVELPDVTVTQVAPDDPAALLISYTFNLAAAVNTYRIRMEGTTDNVAACFHVAQRTDVAY